MMFVHPLRTTQAARPGVVKAGSAPPKAQSKSTPKAQSKARGGFRYDPGGFRWVKDDRVGTVDPSMLEIKPLSGVAYTVWPVMWAELSELPLESVKSDEAIKLQQQGWTIVDARLQEDYEQSHIAGSVNIPLYRPVQGKTRFDALKRLVVGFMAMKATERNPDFIQTALQVLGSKNSKVILACDIGGTLSTKREVAHKVKTYKVRDLDRQFGRESRSLKAAHALYEAGFTNLKHLEGGIQMWRHLGYDMD